MDLIGLSVASDISLPKLVAAASFVQNGTGFKLVRVPRHGRTGRLVHIAIPTVDAAQTAVKLLLDQLYEAPKCVHGYVHGRSTYTNALPHLGQEVILRVDLKSFFSTITRQHLRERLLEFDLNTDTTDLVLDLSCVNDRLAAGFSTSPVLSNIAFASTDADLSRFANLNSLNYTRYADDLTFSGPKLNDETLISVREHLQQHSWTINDRKTRFMRQGGPQFVTGLYVGSADGPRVPRRMKRRLRQQLHYLARFGYEDCHSRVPWTMGQRKIRGWVNYISSIEPQLAADLRALVEEVDFDLPRRIGFDDEWDAWLDEIGVPEDL